MPALLGGTGIIGKDIFVKMKAQKSASVQTSSGTAVTFPQSEERAFSGLSIYGHSTQDGTPSPENPVPIVSAGDSGEINVTVGGKNLIPFPYLSPLGSAGTVYEADGVTYTVQADGGIKCVGTPTNIFGPTLCKIQFSETPLNTNVQGDETNGEMVLSGGPLYFDPHNNATFIYWTQYQNIPVDMTIYPQLEVGTVATAYEPYKTPQTLTLSTPGGLPGIPVSSSGNYTDESGQQWVCDEIDLARGKYVQRVGKVELDGTESYTLSENNGRDYYSIESESFTNFPLTTMSGWSTKGLCTHFQYNNPYSFEGDVAVCFNQNGKNKVRIGFADNINDVEYVKSYMLEQKNSGNPVRLYFALATPIETDLPAEVIADYKALHTYTPNTTVSNDAEAWMKVESTNLINERSENL